ncbi:O-antigen ligase family protein [candidate division KSB1 bacterium]
MKFPEINTIKNLWDIPTLLAMLLAFSMPINRLFSSIVIILMIIHWLFSVNFRSRFRNFLSIPLSWAFPVLFAWYALGIFYSKDTDASLFDIQVKLPLLILPVILLSHGKKIDTKKVILSLIAGLLTAFTIFIIIGCIRNYQMHHTFSYLNPWFFTYILFANPLSMQPNYIAMYICLGLAFCIKEFFFHKKIKRRLVYSLISLLLLFFLILLSSRSQWICSLLIILSAFFMVEMKKKERIFALVFFVLGLVISVFIVMNNSVSRQHFRETFIQNKHPNPAFSGRENRMVIWTSAIKLISENPFIGTGNGDVKDELIRIYHEKGFNDGITYQLNAHNEFLQTAISSGIPAMLFLLFILGYMTYIAIRDKNIIIFSFCITVIISMMTESLLNRQNGVVFIGMFMSLFIFCLNRHSNLNDKF